jgi:hypothetical protein
MRSDPKSLIEMVAGGVPADQLVEGFASLGHYIVFNVASGGEIQKAMTLLRKHGFEYEHMRKTPLPGVEGLAFASKAMLDKAYKLIRKAGIKTTGPGGKRESVEEAAEEKVARLISVFAAKFSGMKIRDIRDTLEKMGDKERGGDPKYVAKFSKAFNEFYKVWREFEKFYS